MQGLTLALAMAAAPCAASAAAVDLYYERTVMSVVGQRCALFTPGVASALAAAQAQARGAALRSGVANAALKGVAATAEAKAMRVDCRSSDVTVPAARVRAGFEGYAHLTKMIYPGDSADWRADRATARQRPVWRLRQDVKFGWDRMVFGLAGREDARLLMAVATFADDAEPYAARLVVRDASRTAGPYLDLRRADAHGHAPLVDRFPPRGMDQVFAAEARSTAGDDLRPDGAKDGWAFRFPAAASDALAALDPRETVAVEFQFMGGSGEEVRTAYVEVGDFAAGRAFLTVAQR